MAVNQPPGMKRTVGFQKLTSFDESLWKKIETEAINKMKAIEFYDIYGSDNDLTPRKRFWERSLPFLLANFIL
jgi:putative N6-adenine-specific DNA methylase